MGVIDLELTAVAPVANDTVSVTIGSATYTYTIQATDTTLDNVRDALINLINSAPDPTVQAYPGGQWDRLILIGRTPERRPTAWLTAVQIVPARPLPRPG